MSHLADALERYYTRKKQGIIFSNGRTLTQLSWDMWAILGYKGMEPSVLSKIINGKRLFNLPQLGAFCQVLNLSASEYTFLKAALGQDILSKHLGADFSTVAHTDIVANPFIQDLILTKIKELKFAGDVKKVLEIAQFFENVLMVDGQTQKTYEVFLAQILNEKARCLMYMAKPSEVIAQVKRINTLALEISGKHADPDMLSMAMGNKGSSLYIAEQWQLSSRFLEEHINKVNKETYVEFIRTLLNNYALTNDTTSYNRTYKKAQRILDKSNEFNASHIASMHEAIGKSLAARNKPQEALKHLEGYNTANLEVFYQSQLLRGKMYIHHMSWSLGNPVDIDAVKEIKKLAHDKKFSSFTRHLSQIYRMSEEILHAQK